jgi:hypothetical protein
MKRPESLLDRLDAASMFMKKVAISLASRKPRGLSAWQADAAFQEAQAIEARISALARKVRPHEPPQDEVGASV